MNGELTVHRTRGQVDAAGVFCGMTLFESEPSSLAPWNFLKLTIDHISDYIIFGTHGRNRILTAIANMAANVIKILKTVF
jgi:hypothetical protein